MVTHLEHRNGIIEKQETEEKKKEEKIYRQVSRYRLEPKSADSFWNSCHLLRTRL